MFSVLCVCHQRFPIAGNKPLGRAIHEAGPAHQGGSTEKQG